MYRIRKLKQEDMQACHDIQHSSHFDYYDGWSEYFYGKMFVITSLIHGL